VSVQGKPTHSQRNSSNSGSAHTEAPKQVNIAFWLYIAAAALSLIGLILSLTGIEATKTAMQAEFERQGTAIDASTLDAAVNASVTVSVVLSILYLAAYVIFAVFMRRGANWARIVLLVLTALSIFEVMSPYGLGAIRLILGVIATVLLFTGPANDYFKNAKARKIAKA
jgi:K+-sensing histidine kinase KdpD